MCKHIASVLYGIGARLDNQPELLFKLRGIDHNELITADMSVLTKGTSGSGKSRRRIADDSLADVFGIEISEIPTKTTTPRRPKKKTAKKTAKKKTVPKRAD